MEPRGIFGIPHGILSSTDEKIALTIGIIAFIAAWYYDGDLDLQPIRGAAAVGILVAIVISFLAPAPISNEWHIPVLVVLLLIGGGVVIFKIK
ncbi:MAG: hypothetical protein ABEI86_04230 [Halobacteriaceae archaeon]